MLLLRRRRDEVARTSTGPLTVLVVDDADAIRQLVCTTLEPEFSVVGEAADGHDAVVLAKECRPDIVLLDLNMPRVDGLQAIAGIRDVSPGSVIVVLTGLAPALIADQALALGADCVVEKATPLHELQEHLRELVAR